MKNVIFYIILYIGLCLLQFFFGKYINIYGIFPNFILIVIVYLGLSKGIIDAELTGFLFGLTWDVFSSEVFGVTAVMFTVIGYFAGRIHRNFNREKVFTQFVIVFFASIIYCLGANLFYFIFTDNRNYAVSFIAKPGFVNIIVTVFAAPVVFYILDRIRRYA
ncbi:MAG: rod shape-determining protein MreD [Endomicrobium sp.]|jgi:rod shape-determining protein MreD|nr:rod shape-determining protein MreD [Endomicrobium sp.]